MENVTLLEGPAGRQAQWVLSRFGRLLRKREIEEHFAPSFLSVISPLKVRGITLAMKVHLPMTITAVEGDEFRLSVSLDAAGEPMKLGITVDATDPHRIAGLHVRPAGPSIGEVLRNAAPRDDVAALIDEHIGSYVRALKGDRAGAVCAVRFRGETQVFAFGAVSPDSIFEIGSITKPITATLLAEMLASGDVALDDPVERYVPAGTTMPPGDPITLLELATHTSGLPRLPVNLDVVDEADPYATFTVEALFDGLSSTPLTARGQEEYSNLGYALLGQILARAAHSSYEDLVTRCVLVPLGMGDARVGPDVSRDGRRVPGHCEGRVVPNWTLAAVAPAGGIEATARDVLSFAMAHADAVAGSPLATTHTRRFPTGDASIGLAWIIEETPRGDVLWHNGGTGGFRSFTGFHPISGTAVAVLTNTSDGNGPDAAGAAVLGALTVAGRES